MPRSATRAPVPQIRSCFRAAPAWGLAKLAVFRAVRENSKGKAQAAGPVEAVLGAEGRVAAQAEVLGAEGLDPAAPEVSVVAEAAEGDLGQEE